MMPAASSYQTGSAEIKASPGLLVAVVLSASGASEITLKDGGASGSELVNLRTGGAGSQVFSPAVPIVFSTSLYLVKDSGTVEVTVVYI